MSTTNTSRWATKLAALDANLLVALDALLQEENVTNAAKRVGITQSAMSQTLARLRHQFDDPILVKVGRRMEPSPFGRRIRPRLHKAIVECEAIVADRPVFDEASASNRFVLAMVDYLSLVLLPALTRDIAARAPGVDLAVHALDAGSIAPELQQGLVDLYVGVAGEAERSLETEPLFVDRMRLVVRTDHPLCADPSLESYADAAHILVSPRREAGSIVSRALSEEGYTRRIAIEVPYFSLVPELVAQSDLVATVPERVATLFTTRHPVTVLPPPLPLPDLEVCMAWHPTFATDPAILWLREVVATVCRAL